MADVNGDCVVALAVIFVLPYPVEQLLRADRAALVFQEDLKYRKFRRRERERLFIQKALVRFYVHY